MKRQLRRLSRLAVVAAAGLAVAFVNAWAEDAPTTLLVIDGSASMWGRLPPDNSPKIDVLRAKFTELLKGNAQTRVGLVSFGQRRADCTDAEVLNPPDTVRDGVLMTLSKLNPRGRGPLANALRAAAASIGASRPAQMLIVSDGADNCLQDACKAAADFAKTATGVPVHVIGVGIAPNEKSQVSCIATATGGQYFEAASTPELAAAIDAGAKLAMLGPGDFSTPQSSASGQPALPPPPAGASLRVAASLGKNTPALGVAIKWRIFKAGDATAAAESEGQAIAAKLPPGDYEIEARLGPLVAREKLSIVPGSSQSIVIPLNGAHLIARASTSKAGPLLPTAVLSLSAADKTITLVRGGAVDLFLAPGTYSLLAIDGTARLAQDVVLAPGDDKPIEMVLRTGTIELEAAGGANSGDILLSVTEDDPDSPDGRREVARSRAQRATFSLPTGTYYVGARSGASEISERVALGIGAAEKRSLNLATATLKVMARIGGRPARPEQDVVFRAEKLGGDSRESERAVGPAFERNLRPGRYKVTATLAPFHLSAAQEVALEAGKTSEQQIDIASAEVTFKASTSGLSGDVFWDVRDAAGVPIWRATGSEATALFAPGNYTVRLNVRGKHKTAPFEVQDGQNKTVELGPG